MHSYSVESRLSDINGTEGQSDNLKCRIIRNTNEKYESKYYFMSQFMMLLNYEENIMWNDMEKSHKQKQYLI
jgi:hypothetical protein